MKQKGFETFEKVDGSLGIIYNYRTVWNVNTRGSFTSLQAIEGTQIMKYSYNMREVPKNISLMVEIIYPENRIIVDYGDQRKLVLLGAYDSYSGKEVSNEQLKEISDSTGMELIKSYHYTSIDELIELQHTMGDHEEGFVVRFANGERVKFKSKEYLKLARLISYVTPLHFWEHMEQGRVKLDIVEKLPEEFRDEVDMIVKALEEKYRSMMREVCTEAAVIIDETKDSPNQKKAIGLRLKEFKHGGCVFTILDGHPEKLEDYVMKVIRPKGNVL
jgi:RNA ligase